MTPPPAPIGPARLVREPLDGLAGLDVARAAGWLAGEPRPVALSGAWAGGGGLLASHPVAIADAHDDPFALLDAQPAVAGADGAGDAVGGGWLGWLGFDLGRRLEPVPPAPPRPVATPAFDLAFHDHVVRRDASGRWWFEALWTDARAAVLRERLATWRGRAAGAAPAAPAGAASLPLGIAAPGADGHAHAVAEAVERIAAGEVFQANVCLRLEAELTDEPLELWRRAVAALQPAYAAFAGRADGAVASLSPELFLRRRGRAVRTEPIKGTTTGDAAALAASPKDRAENVMIVDLMRNDLGRVCAYGSVRAAVEPELRPAAGVVHLVGVVEGTLRAGATDADLLRATFPPGSVTGAPKVRALRVIADLEATAREAYCGAMGYASPVAGLELNVAIRTLECAGGRVWLGAGGGVVADSTPDGEVAEALAKARPVLAAAGLRAGLDEKGTTDVHNSSSPRGRPPARRALAGDRDRPDPARGVLETILVRDGAPVALDDHLARLARSAAALGLPLPGPGLAAEALTLAATAAPGARARLRVVLDAGGPRAELAAAPAEPCAPVALEPVTLPGGLGAHKWADRRLLDALAADLGATPLLVDLDGHVLEAAHAAVALVEDERLVVPPRDGRALPSLSLDALLAAQPLPLVREPVTLDRARRADALVLASALRGPHPGVLPGGPGAEAAARWCDRLEAPGRQVRPRPRR